MKTRLLFCLVLAALLTGGCVRRYVITLNNGTQIGTTSKPKLKGGRYIFKDAEGQPAFVPEGRVTEIAPRSMAREKTKQFLPAGGK